MEAQSTDLNNQYLFEGMLPLVMAADIGERRPNKRRNAEPGSISPQRKRPRLKNKHNEALTEQERASCSSSHSHRDNNGSGGTANDIVDAQCEEKPPPHQSFACPFFRLDAEKYKECGSHHLTTWSRTLQHIKRKHLVGDEYCSRCRQKFENAVHKNDHIRQVCCQTIGVKESGILLEGDYKKIKNHRHRSDKERWIAAWYKLFPGEQVPSPFAESHTEFADRIAAICLEYFQRAAPGHPGLPALACDLAYKLIRILTPAGEIVITLTRASQAVGPNSVPGLGLAAGSLPMPDSTSRPDHPMVPVTNTLSPGRQQILPEPQQASPYLSGGTFSFEEFQGPLPPEPSFQPGPSALYGTVAGLEYPFLPVSPATAADLQGNLLNNVLPQGIGVSFPHDQSVFLGDLSNVCQDGNQSRSA